MAGKAARGWRRSNPGGTRGAMRTAGWNIERRNEKETTRMRGGRHNSRGCEGICWSHDGRATGGDQRERRFGRLRRLLEKGGRNIFAWLHRGQADGIAAASENGLAAESYDVFTFFDEEGFLRPFYLVALSEGAEGGDVLGKRVHG